MRLQQIRDWLGGQAFSDLSQHRIAGGLPMHWSRLPDLIPAALIALLTPLTGIHDAELTAVIVWPGLLFAAVLYLTARLARALGVPGGTAMLVAAIAYPATGLFLPGRIDHHGLQMALLLAVLLALLGPASRKRGAAAGIAAVASLIVGLETAPLIAAAFAVAAIRWTRGDDIDGLALGFGGSLALGVLILRPRAFDWPACDGFTATAFHAELIAALSLAALAAVGRLVAIPRAVMLAGVASTAAFALVFAAPACLSPYGGVDPWLSRVWLTHVAEAQPLFAAPFAVAVGQAGLALVGLAATGWRAWRDRSHGWIASVRHAGRRASPCRWHNSARSMPPHCCRRRVWPR